MSGAAGAVDARIAGRIATAAIARRPGTHARTGTPVVTGGRIAGITVRGTRDGPSASAATARMDGVMVVPVVVMVPGAMPSPIAAGAVPRPIPSPRVVPAPRIIQSVPVICPGIYVGVIIVRPGPIRFVDVGRVAEMDIEAPRGAIIGASPSVTERYGHFGYVRIVILVVIIIVVDDLYFSVAPVFGRHGIPVGHFGGRHIDVIVLIVILVRIFVVVVILVIVISIAGLLGIILFALRLASVTGRVVIHSVGFPVHSRDISEASL